MKVWIVHDDLVGCWRTFGKRSAASQYCSYLDSKGYPPPPPEEYEVKRNKQSIVNLANYVAGAE